LILSSNTHGWNISENFIAEKPLNYSNPWEFGYALGVSRPLTLQAGSKSCVFCRENFAAGLELYDYSVQRAEGPSIGFEPSFGLNVNSVGLLLRFRVWYEVEQIFSHFRRSSH